MDRMQALGRRTAVLFGACYALGVRPSSAQSVPSTSAVTTAIGGCTVRGRSVVPKDSLLWDKAREGRPIARFTGVETPLTAFEFPQDAGQSRVRVHTGAGVGGFRLDGFVDAQVLPFSTVQRVPVIERHVSIESGQSVELVGTAGGRVRIRKSLHWPFEVSVTATLPCRALSLSPPSPPSWNVPANAHGYLLTAGELALYDAPEPRPKTVISLKKNPKVPGVLESGQSVELVGTAGGRVRIRKSLHWPFEVSVTATLPCRALSLSPPSPPSWNVPANAHGYLLTAGELALYDAPEPRQKTVISLKKNPKVPGVLFWSQERKPGWVRLVYQRGLVIDAWAKADAVSALPRAQNVDERLPAPAKTAAQKLLLDGNTRLRKAVSEAPIRSAPRDNGPVIGAIEAEGEVYVLDVVTGWVSVLPKALNVEPHGDGRFWVDAKAFGF